MLARQSLPGNHYWLFFTFFLALGFSLIQDRAKAQSKIFSKLFKNETDTTRGNSFIFLPALSYSQETGLSFGLSSLYSFYTDPKDKLTRSSAIVGFATFTTRHQSFFKLQADTWRPGNRWHQVAELRYKDFPFNFYGIGAGTLASGKDLLLQRSFRVVFELERKLGKHNFAGLTSSYENFDFTDKEPGGVFGGPLAGKNGGNALFTGISYSYDTRDNATYSTRGQYIKANFSLVPFRFDKADFSGRTVKLEGKLFLPLSKQLVLGMQATGQGIYGQKTPFYLLPQLGNDMVMRGYYTGRYRDEKLTTGQAELRYRFASRLGAAAFIGAGKVTGHDDKGLCGLKPSYGGGGRYFFDTERGLSIRADYGLGEKRPGEKRQKGFYISLGEAF